MLGWRIPDRFHPWYDDGLLNYLVSRFKRFGLAGFRFVWFCYDSLLAWQKPEAAVGLKGCTALADVKALASHRFDPLILTLNRKLTFNLFFERALGPFVDDCLNLG